MMKILSFIAFVILLTWSWHIVHSTSPVDFETHSDIQQKLIELIQNTIKSKKPDVKEVEIIKMWTQDVSERKVKATFSYRFTEDLVDRTIDGEALLVREISDNPTVDKWSIQSLQAKEDNISFSEGSVITPDNQSPDENPSSTDAKIPPSTLPSPPEK